MGLGIYTVADPATLISDSGAFTNPLLVRLDGAQGGVVQTKVYLRNDNVLNSYSGIQILPVNSGDPQLIDDTRNISWRLNAGNDQPTDEDWALLTPPNTISMNDLGTVSVSDISTFLPFWVRVEIPRATDVQTIKDVILQVTATEILV